MQNTTNYGLNKPESNDFYDVENFNDNADIIDAKLKNHSDAITALENDVETAQNTADAATNIAKGKNQARVFATTEKMYEWLSDEANKGVAQKGDNLYIVDVGVPDWWIAEVLDTPNADGRYYELGQLETQKVDLTTINDAIDEINRDLDTLGGRLSIVNFPEAYRNTFEITGLIIGTEELYLMIIQESVSFTNRKNPSYAFIYVKDGSAWITLQKGEGSAINNLTFNSGIITVNLSENRYLFASALKLL